MQYIVESWTVLWPWVKSAGKMLPWGSPSPQPQNKQGCLSVLVLLFQKLWELWERLKKIIVQIKAAEAEVFSLLVPGNDQAPKTLDPTFPIVQVYLIRPCPPPICTVRASCYNFNCQAHSEVKKAPGEPQKTLDTKDLSLAQSSSWRVKLSQVS